MKLKKIIPNYIVNYHLSPSELEDDRNDTYSLIEDIPILDKNIKEIIDVCNKKAQYSTNQKLISALDILKYKYPHILKLKCKFDHNGNIIIKN